MRKRTRRSGYRPNKAIANERKHPFIIEVPVAANGLDFELNDEIVAFHKSRRISPKLGRTKLRDGQNYYHWCFSDLTTARAFIQSFGGVYYKKVDTDPGSRPKAPMVKREAEEDWGR